MINFVYYDYLRLSCKITGNLLETSDINITYLCIDILNTQLTQQLILQSPLCTEIVNLRLVSL